MVGGSRPCLEALNKGAGTAPVLAGRYRIYHMYNLENVNSKEQAPLAPRPPRARSSRTLAYLALALSVLIIGCSAVAISYADAPAEVLVFYRTGIGSLVTAAPFLWGLRRKPAGLGWRSAGLAAAAGVLFAFNSIFWALGIQVGGPTLPTLFANTSPVWVSLGALLLFRERLGRRFFTGLALALAGSAAIVLANGAQGGSQLGVLFGLCSSLFFAGYFLVAQRARRELGVLNFFWLSSAVSALTCLALALLKGSPLIGFSNLTWLVLAGLGLVTQVVGFLAVGYTLGSLPAALVSPVMLLQLVVTAGMSYFLLGESFTWAQALGGGLILLGVWLIIRSSPA